MKKLLVVVDYQKDFVDGALGFPGAEKLDDPICAKIEDYTGADADVVFTFDTHDQDYLQTQEGKKLPVPHCIKGSDGWQLYGKTAAHLRPDSVRFEKSCFGSMELATYAAKGAYDEVELCGLVSNICVLSNAILIKAALPEARVIVDARCTACADPAANEQALDCLEGVQVDVVNREASGHMETVITKALTPEGREIRSEIFLDEQKFHDEFDEIDETTAQHLVLYVNGKAAAVGRLFPTPDDGDSFTIGRVAVRADFRGKRLGSAVMRALEEEARKQGAKKIVLAAQQRARHFYETLGYSACGELFLDEYCPHIPMCKIIL